MTSIVDSLKVFLMFLGGNRRWVKLVVVVDVPVVPAGTIVLKNSIISLLFRDLASLARYRIHLCVSGSGFFRSAAVS